MKLARDTWLVFGRYFGLFIRNPAWVALGVLQPVIYLVLFAPLLGSIAKVQGFPPGGAYNVFVPGLLVQLGMFGAAGVGFSLIAELRAGVIERLRVTPVSRVALLLGRALRDMLSIVVQSLILILISLPFGLNIHPIGVVIIWSAGRSHMEHNLKYSQTSLLIRNLPHSYNCLAIVWV